MPKERFRIRGYIEGFYGRPWTQEQRLDMLRFAAAHGANACFYAPKDDPYHRRLWREPYPPQELARLRALKAEADANNVALFWCVAPGLSMRYADPADRDALQEKLASLYAVGVRDFGLLLDDIPADLFHPADRERFGETVEAHIDLCRDCFARLRAMDGSVRLVVCPTQYHGKGTEDYITRLGKALPEDVLLFFTGADICSKELTCREARIFYEATGHKPLYWDNYPVNDAEMFKEMHIGPLIGREPELYRYAEGIVSNCMEYYESGKFALATAFRYMADPPGYDPEAAFADALAELLPEEDVREAFTLFADHLRTSCLKDENSRLMGEAFGRAGLLLETGDLNGAMAVIAAYTARVRRSADLLRTRTGPLFTELAEWLAKYDRMAEILDAALALLQTGQGKEALAAKMKRYNDCATVLTAFCFREYVETVLRLSSSR